MTACLDISNLSATLPSGQRVLRSVSLTVEPGEVRALVGESGAGKSMIGKAARRAAAERQDRRGIDSAEGHRSRRIVGEGAPPRSARRRR